MTTSTTPTSVLPSRAPPRAFLLRSSRLIDAFRRRCVPVRGIPRLVGCDRVDDERKDSPIPRPSSTRSIDDRGEFAGNQGRERISRPSRNPSLERNAPQRQFTGNQPAECFVVAEGEAPHARFIRRCHRRVISPAARCGTTRQLRAMKPNIGPRGSPTWIARVINTARNDFEKSCLGCRARPPPRPHDLWSALDFKERAGAEHSSIVLHRNDD